MRGNYHSCFNRPGMSSTARKDGMSLGYPGKVAVITGSISIDCQKVRVMMYESSSIYIFSPSLKRERVSESFDPAVIACAPSSRSTIMIAQSDLFRTPHQQGSIPLTQAAACMLRSALDVRVRLTGGRGTKALSAALFVARRIGMLGDLPFLRLKIQRPVTCGPCRYGGDAGHTGHTSVA